MLLRSLLPFSAIGLELWSMTDQIYFDNFLIVEDEKTAEEFARVTWLIKKQIELTKSASSSDSVIDGLLKAANDKPWLWAIYLLVILLPVVLIALFCFGGSKKPSASSKTSAVDPAQTKKTDAHTADVVDDAGQSGDANGGVEDDDEDDDGDDSAEKVEKEDLEEMDEVDKVNKDFKKKN